MAAAEQKVIATAGLISVAVGSANSIVKYKQPPSSRFLIGSGVAYLALSAMGQTEALGELAKGLAVGVMSTILLGEGGGVMTYFVGKTESDTRRPQKDDPAANRPARDAAHSVAGQTPPRQQIIVTRNGQAFRPDRFVIQPFTPGTPIKLGK